MERIEKFVPEYDRYVFDLHHCTNKKGFAQVDTGTDAPYYGMWANPFDRRIVTYAEGDVIIQTAADMDEFAAEIRRIAAWHNDPDNAPTSRSGFRGIDCGLDQEMKQAFCKAGLDDLLH